MTDIEMALAKALRECGYWQHDYQNRDHAARILATEPMQAIARRLEPPPHTRLILASEDLLEQFGTRTENGSRITAEWGEQKPEGWYEPTFTRHADDDIARQAAIGAAVEADDAKVVTVESLRSAMVRSRVYAGDMAASTAAARIIFAALGDDHECGLECSDAVIEADDLRGQR